MSSAHLGHAQNYPGCSLCMGNQARVLANPNSSLNLNQKSFLTDWEMEADVFLSLSRACSHMPLCLGKPPSPQEYLKYMEEINPLADDIYRYLNFNELDQYVESANAADIPADQYREVPS